PALIEERFNLASHEGAAWLFAGRALQTGSWAAVKELIGLSPALIEERFNLASHEGAAWLFAGRALQTGSWAA
ncbi:hypothetical protein V5H41_29175, partial [Salmonella enterica]